MWTICSDKLSKLIEYQWKTDGSVSAVDHFYTKNSFIEPLVQSTTYHIARRTDFFFCFPPSNPFVYRYTFVCVCVLVFFCLFVHQARSVFIYVWLCYRQLLYKNGVSVNSFTIWIFHIRISCTVVVCAFVCQLLFSNSFEWEPPFFRFFRCL